ncbi:hypothetical protein MJL22_27875, partial [Salmonella enterica subsp. enterica serovar Montevideo]|nr:hypothetical protein [Salmonella enterica subsp. enterica serovar Montevideo]
SAALDLAYVAAGRVDGFFEIGLRPWDFAAGELLVREAGGIVSLTAALSVYNSCVYCNSRMLFGLAQQGNAPKALLNVDKRGVPV